MFIIQFMVSLALSVINALAGGFVLSHLWSWFIVPLFAVQTIGYLGAVGLMLTLNFLWLPLAVSIGTVGEALRDRKSGDETLVDGIVRNAIMVLVVYPLALLGGFIWHLVIGG